MAKRRIRFPGKHKIDTHDGLKENAILERLDHLGKGGSLAKCRGCGDPAQADSELASHHHPGCRTSTDDRTARKMCE
jgi:hypothetical protein